MPDTKKPETTYNRGLSAVVCPHCGFVNDLDDWYSDLHAPETLDAECYECEKSYRAVFAVSVAVRAIPLLNGREIKHG